MRARAENGFGRPVGEAAKTGAAEETGNALLAFLLIVPEEPAEEIDVLEHHGALAADGAEGRGESPDFEERHGFSYST